MIGYLYILNNAAFPGLLKIGGTTRLPEDRARELSSTGVPSRYAVVHAEQVSDWVRAEHDAFRALAAKRYGKDREFFEVTVQEAIKIISDIARQWAPEQAKADLQKVGFHNVEARSTVTGRRREVNDHCPACGRRNHSKANFTGTLLTCHSCGTRYRTS